MTEQPDIQVTLILPASTVELLSVLIDGTYIASLESLLTVLADHVREGVQRPGSWEREWLASAFGYDWMERLERDPDVPHRDRVRKEPGNG